MRKLMQSLACFAVLAMLLAVTSGAQQQGQQQSGQQQGQQQQGQQPPAQPAQPEQPAVNPAEEADYKAFLAIPRSDMDKQIAAGEEFLKKWPESRGREFVYGRLATIAYSRGQADKAMAYSEKGLGINPDNLDMLSIMANVIPRRANPEALDFSEKLAKAEQYSKRAIELIAALPKPETLSEEEFTTAKNMKLSMCHSGLGVVYFHKQRFGESATELEQATQLVTPPDPTDVYVLGIAYSNQKRFADAATTFEKCGGISWTLQEQCKQLAADSKKQAAKQQPPKQQ